MSIVVRYSPIGLTTAQYEESLRLLEESDVQFPPEGLDYHVCFGSDGDLKVSEIWDSPEQLEEFGPQLMPILAEVGIEFAGPPEIFEAHNVLKP